MPYTYRELPDEFARDYFKAALETTTDVSDESGGQTLDRNYGIQDFGDETVKDMLLDCKEFQAANADDLDLVSEVGCGGRDFWLTRNDHGVGFRDRGWQQSNEIKNALDRLSKAARKWGEYDLWVGSVADLDADDGDRNSDDDDDENAKKIYASHTRAADARYAWRKARKRAVNRRATSPHGRCVTSEKCLEHAADKSVPSCKQRQRHRRK